MSKMLDELENKSARKNVPGGLGMHDEIAKTYFHAPHKKNMRKDPAWISFLPWIVTALVIIAALAIVLSKSSIDVKVRLLGEIPALKVSQAEGIPDKGVFLVKGSEPQADIAKNAYFTGDARTFSAARKDDMMLCNARGAGWANYTIELKEPVDLNNLDIKYAAKGSKGDECLLLVIADSNNRIYRMQKDLSSSLTNDWKRYTINFRPVRKILDLSSITSIKFEFGSLTAGNSSAAVIYLKDIYLAKTRRLKWL